MRGHDQVPDLAILLPRIEGDEIKADTAIDEHQELLSRAWLTQVGEAYFDTDVADGFLEESWYEDWQLVSIRIAPCSPLGKRPGDEAKALCWPEVRLVWQPVIYDFFIGWTTTEAFSDDRAIHALYRAYPEGGQAEVDDMLNELKALSTQRPIHTDDLPLRFLDLRRQVVQQLLGDVLLCATHS